MPNGQKTAQLAAAVEELLEALGYELVELKLIPRGHTLCVEVRIDHRDAGESVTVRDCAAVSRALGAEPAIGDLLPMRHVLEVSSPGINRPLTRPEHYARFRGEQAVLKLRQPHAGRRTWTGTVVAAGERSVTIAPSGYDPIEVGFSDIASAHLKVDPWKSRRKR